MIGRGSRRRVLIVGAMAILVAGGAATAWVARHRLHDANRAPTFADRMHEMRFLQRSSGRGHIPRGHLVAAKVKLDAMRERQAELHRDAGLWTWTWLGPGNIGGRVRAIAIHPTIPARMWIGSASGGIWHTTDGGASWVPVDDFMASLAVTTIAIDPTDPDVLYAGTGEGFTSRVQRAFDLNYAAPPGAGIFRSVDGGITWAQLPSTDQPDFDYVNRISVDPATGDVYAALARPQTIVKSTDGGATWTTLLTTPGIPTDVKVSLTVSNRVLVGCDGDGDSSGDVFYSTNYGATWTEQTTGAAGAMPEDVGRCEVAFAPGDVVYVLADRNNGEIWRSSNIGAVTPTWSLRSTPAFLNGQGWYNEALWVDPTNVNFVIAGGVDLYRSANGGTSFTKISDFAGYHLGWSAHGDQHVIVSHPDYDGTFNRRLYFGNDGGIQTAANAATVTTSSGWTNLCNGLGITQFYAGAASPDGSIIVGGTQDNDKLRYTGGSVNSWYQAATGDGGYCAVDFDDPSYVYGEYIYLWIGRSSDGGDTYLPASSGIVDAGSPSTALFIAPFIMDPNDSQTLYAGGIRLWRTTNRAVSWSLVRNGLSGNPKITTIGVKDGDPGEIWVGYTDGNVLRSTNGGSTWTDVDAGIPDRWVMDVAVSPYYANEAIITLAGVAEDNVWITVNGGTSWFEATGSPPDDLPAMQVNTVTYHPTNPDWIYIGTDLGVLASENFGATWNVTPHYAGNDGPANVEVDDLFWHGEYLVAATYGRGMYRSRPLDVVYVDAAASGTEDGSAAHPYDTVGEGIGASGNGTQIVIDAATYTEGSRTFDRKGLVTAAGGTVVVR